MFSQDWPTAVTSMAVDSNIWVSVQVPVFQTFEYTLESEIVGWSQGNPVYLWWKLPGCFAGRLDHFTNPQHDLQVPASLPPGQQLRKHRGQALNLEAGEVRILPL